MAFPTDRLRLSLKRVLSSSNFLSRASSPVRCQENKNGNASPTPSFTQRVFFSSTDDKTDSETLFFRKRSADRRARLRGWNAAFGTPYSDAQQPNFLAPFGSSGDSSPTSASAPGQNVPTAEKGFNYARLGLCQINGNVFGEDRFAFDELFLNGSSLFLLGVFDGHGGWQVAHYLQKQLLPEVLKELKRLEKNGQVVTVQDPTKFSRENLIPSTTNSDMVGQALITAFENLDESLKKKVSASVRLGFDRFVRVGACACTVAVTETHYVVANAGDCRAVLCRKGGEAVALSNVHNADDEKERKRLRESRPDEDDAVVCTFEGWLDPKNGEVYAKWKEGREKYEAGCYMKGVLQPTRAFGDFALKDKELNKCFGKGTGSEGAGAFASELVEGMDFEKGPYLSATPELTLFPRFESDELLVLGSDGLFDYLSNDEICQIARAAASPEAAAGALADAVKLKALHENGISQKDYDALPESKKRDIHDDVTVTVFYIQFPEPWRKRFYTLSESLQRLCDGVTEKSASVAKSKFDFSVCIADPSLADCPLVAVSKGFERLTGYRVEDAIGRNCRFLSFGVPEKLRDEDTTLRLRKFTQVATSGDPFAEFEEESRTTESVVWLPEELRGVGGASFFVRWNRRRDGTLFRNLFVLRQVWVGDRTYIVALQTALSDKDSVRAGGVELSKETLREVARLAEAVSSDVENLLPSLTKTKESSMAENRELSEAMRRFRKGEED